MRGIYLLTAEAEWKGADDAVADADAVLEGIAGVGDMEHLRHPPGKPHRVPDAARRDLAEVEVGGEGAGALVVGPVAVAAERATGRVQVRDGALEVVGLGEHRDRGCAGGGVGQCLLPGIEVGEPLPLCRTVCFFLFWGSLQSHERGL